MARERDKTGQYVESVGLDDVLDLFDQVEGPVITSSDVAEAFDCTTEAARQKLQRLFDRGLVDRRKTGRTTVYWRTESTDRPGESPPRDPSPAEAPERREESVEENVGEDTDADRGGQERAPAARETSGSDEAALASVEFPSGRDRDACVDAVLAARDHLQEQGTASMRDFVTGVMPDHSLEYDVPDLEPGERYRGAWWRKIVKPGLDALPDVEYRDGYGDYQYAGDDR